LDFERGLMSDDERAIREVVQIWMEATTSGDLERVLGLMTDDVVFMTPGQEPFGKDEFRARSEGMKGGRFDGWSEIREIKVLGDWAWIRNHLDLTVTPPVGGQPMHRAGYTLTIFQKCADGRWRLARDANLVT